MTHEIITDERGWKHATDGTHTVSMPSTGRMFKRRAIKSAGTPNAQEVCWLVAEIDGVRVYQSGAQIIVTRDDLYP